MEIRRELLDKIAHLSRLEFEEKDAEKMMKDMTAIVDWVEKLSEVDTTGVEPLTTMSHEVNALREDSCGTRRRTRPPGHFCFPLPPPEPRA